MWSSVRKRSRRLRSATPESLALVALLLVLGGSVLAFPWYWSAAGRQSSRSSMDNIAAGVAATTTSHSALIVARFLERIRDPSKFVRMPLGGMLLDLVGMDESVQPVLQGTSELGLTLQAAIDAAFLAALREPSLRIDRDFPTTEETQGEGLCASLGGLDLGSNALSNVCDSIRSCRRLELLFLTNNQLTVVPAALQHLPLTRLSLKENRLTSLNPRVELPATLVHLIVTENRIATFASSFSDGGRFSVLRKLMLGGNALTDWSQAVGFSAGQMQDATQPHDGQSTTLLPALQLLRLSRNAMADASTALGSGAEFMHAMSSMPRLSWFSIAGNPCMLPEHTQRVGTWHSADVLGLLSSLTDLSSRVVCRRSATTGPAILGRGASGIVLHCVLDGSRDVAVKFFKRVSSDGSGADEILALSKVRNHRNLLAPVGYLAFRSADELARHTGLPLDFASDESFAFSVEGEDGRSSSYNELRIAVVFPLVRAQNLGKPPTIWTVADDIFSVPQNGGSNLPQAHSMAPSSLLQEWGAFRDLPAGKAVETYLAASDSANVDYYYEVVSASLLGALMLVEGIASAVASLHLCSSGRLLHGDVYAHNMFFGLLAAEDGQKDERGSAMRPPEAKIRGAMGTLELSSTSWWLSRRILLSDFGAAFPYDHLPVTVHAALRSLEVRSVLVFVADVLEHIVPLRFLASQPETLSHDARQLSPAISSRLSSLETSLEIIAAACRDNRHGSRSLKEHCLRSVSAVALVVSRCAGIARGDADESFEGLLAVMSDAAQLL